ncbi:MAG: DUF262 domain-containing protein [Lactobacillaceae bacterium]|jgi:hypothetical protein|nr:DUF262 domain-containing protein [Lactobacillaceae bacterium]
MSAPIEIPQPAGYTMEMLFQQNNFSVPVYQRNYAWQKNELYDFWRDLEDIIKGRRDNHFFGQVVTYKHDAIQDLIDGQQRITTSIIFLAVIRDVSAKMLSEHREQLTEDAKDILRGDIVKYINNKLIRGVDGEVATLNLQKASDSDQQLKEYFYNITHEQDGRNLDSKTEPMLNMDAAYDDFYNRINSEIKNLKTIPDRVKHLERILQAFIEKFYVVLISAPSQADAFIIFETLNSRGADLKPSDIIKNHLMYLLENDLNQTNEKWSYISEILKADSNRITSFIRSYWAASHHLVTEGALYRTLSQDLTTEADGQEFLTDLVDLVHPYDVLENPWNPKANRELLKNALLHEEIDILDKMNVKLYYPIFLAMRKRGYSEADIAVVLNQVIAVFIRHRTILNFGTNTLENGFSSTANKIYRAELNDVNEIVTDLRKPTQIHADSEVASAFMMLSKDGGQKGQKKWSLAYLLAEIAYAETVDEYYDPIFIQDAFELVRIAELNNLDDDVDNEHESRIGNWTLIEKNYKFNEQTDDKKLAQLKTSVFPGNNALAQEIEQGWNNQKIETRQAAMANQARVIWQ